jgi:hypothetical protein
VLPLLFPLLSTPFVQTRALFATNVGLPTTGRIKEVGCAEHLIAN